MKRIQAHPCARAAASFRHCTFHLAAMVRHHIVYDKVSGSEALSERLYLEAERSDSYSTSAVEKRASHLISSSCGPPHESLRELPWSPVISVDEI